MNVNDASTPKGYVSDLRKVHMKYDSQIHRIITDLESHAANRHSEYKECEELARQSGKITSRWRRITSLAVEAFTEFNTELEFEIAEIRMLEAKLAAHDIVTKNAQNDNVEMQRLIDSLQASLT